MVRNASLLLASVLILAPAVSAPAARPKKPQAVFTNPKKAGPDFAVQGEYTGTVETDQGKVKQGVQVIALGNGKFHAVGYHGGLPGDGWDQKEKIQAEGQTSGGVTTFVVEDEDVRATLKDGLITVKDADGQTVAEFKKVIRKSPTLGKKPPQGAVVLFDGKSPTLGKKPPQGAVVLFDGKSPDAFQGGRMTENGLLMEGVTSKQTFGSFTLHVEFRTPFMPLARGQGRGNSGFYAQGRYEVQILDSFGLEGMDNECGGIYTIARPKVNMCFPPLSWQTYDVDYTAAVYEDGKKVKNATMTVRHNGVLIHEDQELPHDTTAAPVREGPEPGPIYLQNHGNPVRFRNIWLMEKK